jgi:hypothetical protein
MPTTCVLSRILRCITANAIAQSRTRNESLVDQHSRTSGKEAAAKIKAQSAVWDRDRDMALGGRLMDEGKRQAALRDASTLSTKFAGSSYL